MRERKIEVDGRKKWTNGQKESVHEGLEPSALVLGGLRATIAPAHQWYRFPQ